MPRAVADEQSPFATVHGYGNHKSSVAPHVSSIDISPVPRGLPLHATTTVYILKATSSRCLLC